MMNAERYQMPADEHRLLMRAAEQAPALDQIVRSWWIWAHHDPRPHVRHTLVKYAR